MKVKTGKKTLIQILKDSFCFGNKLSYRIRYVDTFWSH
jgi:hypothetical protein